jgi:hypothetical protein
MLGYYEGMSTFINNKSGVHMSFFSSNLKAGAAITALVFSGVAFSQTPDVKPARIRGDIISASDDTITVHRRSGDTVTIDIKKETPVAALRNIALGDIKSGSFVGTAATTGTDGKLTATEVLVFPEAMRGAGEGHFAYDLAPNSTMTNANVDEVVTGTSGHDLKLSYKGGSNTITVPDGVPVVTLAPAMHADLIAGKKVFIIAIPVKGSEFKGLQVVVEKDGVVPQM